MGFRERIGLVEPRAVLQTDSLDDETRVILWNSIYRLYERLESGENRYSGKSEIVAKHVWQNALGRAADEFPARNVVMRQLKSQIVDGDWSFALEAVEYFGIALAALWHKAEIPVEFQKQINRDLSRCLVGYRFVAGELVQVSEDAEVDEVEGAIDSGGPPATHLQRALQLLSNREAPQYANVVHEAIHAVEAKIASMTGRKVLSDGLKALEAAGYPIHSALAGGWTKLYGYTSDAGGIRHALVRDEEIDETLAVYFLVSCSAFVNFLTKVEAKGA